MKFYALHEGFYEGVQLRLDLLKSACEKLGITFVALNSLTTDYTQLPQLGKTDMLYNCARGSQVLESLLLNDDVTTFYIKNPQIHFMRSTTEWSIIHEKIGLPAPKTIHHLTSNRQLLQHYVAYLGGFPIILKVAGGTRGIGTIKVESWHSLYSVVDYLATTTDNFIMRQFIDADFGARLMVLGNEVIASAKFMMQENDFRNAPILSATHYEPFAPNSAVVDICIKAVRSVNLEMAGVDILFDKQNNPYLLEINFSTGFQSFKDKPDFIQNTWLQYLIQKTIQ